ncbi:deazaflavin-dependent oxidoreductase (nitroreductase family) [Prauserella isguenensis]|uniref:Deazaflavin-dependent oxidoreductase (Nitroreductase family) n=1 Tax=Prauserella isguenensis TaxID=1470180 RepID=A0A839RX87_9PSEU|nr:nitroreductase/quinone reductase family protein [Prauserella isguenensis]MBB3050046.1 deazaflavin-dependent oxidoreductase (nitroreductase family) [Prauserella isguenensis]
MNFHQSVIDEFRGNQGRVGGMFADARLLLLTTTGAKSGLRHTSPLGYFPDGRRLLVVASAAGSDKHPDWFHNIRADPSVTVEDGTFTYDAHAEVLDGEERDTVFARLVEAEPGFDDYQRKTSRVLPVVALSPASDGPPGGGSLADVLVGIHDGFRRELALIKKELAGSGPSLGVQLRVNCMTLCQGLHNHHVGEDKGLFEAIGARHPELAATLARLRREHEAVADLTTAIQAAVREESRDTARAEVERLADALERHLDHEEEQLLPVLRAM